MTVWREFRNCWTRRRSRRQCRWMGPFRARLLAGQTRGDAHGGNATIFISCVHASGFNIQTFEHFAHSEGGRVGTQTAPIHSGSHSMPPDPKDFSILPVRRMKLEDGSVGAVSNDSEMSIHTIYLKIRAFFYTAVFVNIDQTEWFDLAAAEALIDRIMNFLHHRHSAGRPPISFCTTAWESTARAFQLGIRSGKTLKELASQESVHVPDTSRTERARAEKSPQRGAGKARGKEGGRDRAREEGDKVAKIQRTKDREIAPAVGSQGQVHLGQRQVIWRAQETAGALELTSLGHLGNPRDNEATSSGSRFWSFGPVSSNCAGDSRNVTFRSSSACSPSSKDSPSTSWARLLGRPRASSPWHRFRVRPLCRCLCTACT